MIYPHRKENTVKLTRLALVAFVAAVLIPATGCWRPHCCHDSYKPAPAPAPAYYIPANGCP
jgi:hypothetical protein